MKLSDLYLNRFLYRDNKQDFETKDSAFISADSTDGEPVPIYSGGAAQDINTGNVQIDGAQLEPGTFPTTTLDVSNWGWGQTCVFTSTDLDTVSWGAGTFTSASGTAYSIAGNNTGNMAAKTYIYLDLNVSEVEYQTTTTSATSVGLGKVLIAVAENAADSATYNLSEATQIVGDNILANTIDASKITTGQLIVGTNVGLGSAFPNASAGDLAYLSLVEAAKLGTTVISGGYIITSLLNATNIQTGTLDANIVTVSNLAADDIKSGTLSIGSASQPSLLTIIESSSGGAGSTSSLLQWKSTGGTLRGKIWTDSTGDMGHNAYGGDIIFYGNSNQMFQLIHGLQAVVGTNTDANGLKVHGNFNIGNAGGTSYDARINGGHFYFNNTGTAEYVYATGNDIYMNATSYSRLSVGGTSALRASSTGVTIEGAGSGGNSSLYLSQVNNLDFKDWTLTLTADKTIILPTSKGFNALYCTESPEVWFMDFCDEKGVFDPMFGEVTVGPYRYIKCEDGGYQVWGKRKGKENLRFESKTEEEFLANESLYKFAKQ